MKSFKEFYVEAVELQEMNLQKEYTMLKELGALLGFNVGYKDFPTMKFYPDHARKVCTVTSDELEFRKEFSFDAIDRIVTDGIHGLVDFLTSKGAKRVREEVPEPTPKWDHQSDYYRYQQKRVANGAPTFDDLER